MGIVSFGMTDKAMLYPVYSSIFSLIRTFTPHLFNENNRYKSSISFRGSLMGEGMLICIFLEIIRIHRVEKHYIQPLIKYKDKPRLIPLLILSGFMDFFGYFFGSIAGLGKDSDANTYYLASFMMIFEFLFVYFIYYLFFFHTRKLYRHHLVSVGLIVIGTLLGVGAHLKLLSWTDFFSILSSIDIAFIEILLYKLASDSDSLSPYEITWIQGFIDIIISAVLCIILSFVPCSNPIYCASNGRVVNLIKDFTSIFTSWHTIFQVVVYIITSFGHNIFHIQTTVSLGPTHRIISDGIVSLISMTFALDKQEIDLSLIYRIVGHILFTVGLLMYNEIIIVHMCDLDEETNQCIHDRGRRDSKLEIKDKDENQKSFIQQEMNKNYPFAEVDKTKTDWSA